MSLKVETEEASHIERLKCRMSLLYYLTHYVYVQDAVEQKIIRWRVHPHLLKLVELVQEWYEREPRQARYIIIFKARQVYATTLLAAIANWLAAFNESTRVIEQSQGIREAQEFLARSRFINSHHPSFLRLKLFPDQDDIIGFPATNSQIKALPSTESAGRSTDATFVTNDEWERHRNARENFAAVQPTMAKGGLFIGASTVDKTNMETLPKEIWYAAKSGKNSFVPLFWHYFVVPGRNEETYQLDTRGLPDWQREAEYPRNEKEALSAPKTIGFFNHDILEKVLAECREPVEVRYGGKVRIYTHSISNRRFAFAIDPSEGREDPSVGILSDVQTEEDVACFNGKFSLEEQAKLAFELYKEYNEPLVAVERNASGLTLIEKLTNLGVTNWFYSDNQKQKKGWYTASYGVNRERILNEFAEAIHLRRKRIPIKDCVLQMFEFAWVNGRPQAIHGAHDDWILCESILGQMTKFLPSSGLSFSSFVYQTRSRR